MSDARRHGWFPIYKAATQRIREHFQTRPNGLTTATALAVYGALLELENDGRRMETFEVFRRDLADRAGVGLTAASKYQSELEAAGVIHVERRVVEGVNLPNIVHVLDERDFEEVDVSAPDPGMQSDPGVDRSATDGSDAEQPPSEEPPTASPSVAEEVEEARAPARQANGHRPAHDPEAIPGDFPDELEAHLLVVVPILTEVAEAKHGQAVHRGAVARTIMARPRKPIVKAAHDFAAYFLEGRGAGKPQKDVVAGYRNWLDREGNLAVTEALPGQEVATVTPINGRPLSAREKRQEESRSLIENLRRQAGVTA